MTPVVVAGFTLLGLLLGSFATALSHRVPRGEPIGGKERSRCPHCGAPIVARDNLPVLSYLLLRGRCRSCGEPISVHYPVVEITSGLLFLAAAVRFEGFVLPAVYAAFFWVLIVLTVIDIETRLLPDRIIFPAVVLATIALVVIDALHYEVGLRVQSAPLVAASGLLEWSVLLGAALALSIAAVTFPWPPWKAMKRVNILELDDAEDVDAQKEVEPLGDTAMLAIAVAATIAWVVLVVGALAGQPRSGLAGALIGAGIFSGFLFAVSLFVPQGMGGGDVKLALLLGLLLGYLSAPALVLTGMFLAFTLGGILGLVTMLVKRGDRKTQLPFGPYLAAGTVAAILVGNQLVDVYLDAI